MRPNPGPTTSWSARSPARSTTWTCGSPVGSPSRRSHTCRAATSPERWQRSASGVEGVSVGDEVVVNPAVSTLEAIVTLGNDSPLGRGFGIVGEQRWGGHGEMVAVPVTQRRPTSAEPLVGRVRGLPAGHAHRPPHAAPGPAAVGRDRAHRRHRRRGVDGGARAVGLDRRPGLRHLPRSRQDRRCDRDGGDRRLRFGRRPVAGQGRCRGRERRPRDLGPERLGVGARRSARRVWRHVGSRGHRQPAEAVLQADRDHRVDDGEPSGVRRGDRDGRPRACRSPSTRRSASPTTRLALERLEAGKQLGKIVLEH